MLYLPSQPPNEDPQAQRAFGLPEGKKDQPLTPDAARQWAEVIREWSDRYGDRVSGWWFDGGYDSVRFDGRIASIYAAAARHGNAASIVTFNPGVMLVRHTRAEDYTAGETDEPFGVLPASRFVDGAQWHALTYLGSHWGARDTRYATARWTAWARAVASKDGVVTIDVGPNWDPKAGPIGAIDAAQLEQLSAIGAAGVVPFGPDGASVRTVRGAAVRAGAVRTVHGAPGTDRRARGAVRGAPGCAGCAGCAWCAVRGVRTDRRRARGARSAAGVI